MTSGVRCKGDGLDSYTQGNWKVLLTVMCVELGSECGVERKGVVGEGGWQP